MKELTEEDKLKYQNAKYCECCTLSFKKYNLIKCCDHDHFSGKFKSTLCVSCNFEMDNFSFVSIYFHNVSYDSHFIIRELGCDEGNIDIIPNSSEKYISFSKSISSKFRIKFVDTFRFISDSSSNLAKNLSEDKSKFAETLKVFSSNYLDFSKILKFSKF